MERMEQGEASAWPWRVLHPRNAGPFRLAGGEPGRPGRPVGTSSFMQPSHRRSWACSSKTRTGWPSLPPWRGNIGPNGQPGYFIVKPAKPWQTIVAQASQPAVSQVSKPACRVYSITHSHVFAPSFHRVFPDSFPNGYEISGSGHWPDRGPWISSYFVRIF